MKLIIYIFFHSLCTVKTFSFARLVKTNSAIVIKWLFGRKGHVILIQPISAFGHHLIEVQGLLMYDAICGIAQVPPATTLEMVRCLWAG